MKKYLSIILLVIFTTFSFAQKIKIIKGDFDFLKGQKEINVEFVYDNMKLFKKNLSNDQYVKERVADLEKKSRGKGKHWAKKWIFSRESIYEPKFLELMNRYLEKDQGIYFEQNNTNAKYTLIVETVWVYPGWNAGVMRQAAKVSTLLKFVETTNKEKVLAEVTSKHAPGNRFGGTYSNEDRLGEGYAKTGKSFAKLIIKKTF